MGICNTCIILFNSIREISRLDADPLRQAGDFPSTCACVTPTSPNDASYNAGLVASSSRHCAHELFAALHKSAFGTKRTFRDVCSLSTFGGKADIYVQIEFSAFDPADIGSQASVETIAVLIRVSRYPGGAP